MSLFRLEYTVNVRATSSPSADWTRALRRGETEARLAEETTPKRGCETGSPEARPKEKTKRNESHLKSNFKRIHTYYGTVRIFSQDYTPIKVYLYELM